MRGDSLCMGLTAATGTSDRARLDPDARVGASWPRANPCSIRCRFTRRPGVGEDAGSGVRSSDGSGVHSGEGTCSSPRRVSSRVCRVWSFERRPMIFRTPPTVPREISRPPKMIIGPPKYPGPLRPAFCPRPQEIRPHFPARSFSCSACFARRPVRGIGHRLRNPARRPAAALALARRPAAA